MEWGKHSAFGYDVYEFYDDGDNYIGSYIPKRNKISIPKDLTEKELRFIYHVIKNR